MIARLIRVGVLVLGLVVSLSAQNVRINDDLLARALTLYRVHEWAITPDGMRVVYRARSPEPPGTELELFTRLLDRSSPSIPLNGRLSGVFDEHPFFFAAAGRLVFDADENGDRVFELYSAPWDGSAGRIRLSEPGGSVVLLGLDPTGARAVYKHLVGFSGYGTLHVVPVDGSALPLTLVATSNGGKAWVAPDDARVVYSIQNPTDPFGHEDLFVEPLDGSGAPLFLDATPSGFFGFYRTFEDLVFTPDGVHAVYHRTLDVDGDISSTGHSVPLDASRPSVQVGFTIDATSNSLVITGSPPRLVFRSSAAVVSTFVDGSQPVTLSPAGFSPTSQPKLFGNEVVFSASSSAGHALFRVPGDGSQAATQLVPGGPSIREFKLAPPQFLAYVRGGTTAFGGQACVVSLAGGTPIPLHPALPGAQGTRELIPHPDGQRILLLGDLDVADVTDLHVAPLDASTPPTRLNEPRSLTSDVFETSPEGSWPLSPRITPGGDHVIYWQQDVPLQDLFTVPLDGSDGPEQLNEPTLGTAIAGDVTRFQLSQDGRLLVFRADQHEDEHFDLFAVSTDAPGTPHSLTSDQPSVEDGFALVEPGPQVVFRTASGLFVAHASGDSTVELDSSALGFADDVAAASDGRRLVYRKQVATGRVELWSVVLDGLSAPIRLHEALAPGRSVTAFRVAADDTVVFRSDLLQNDVFELFAVPAEGGAPLRLNAPLVANGDVQGFEVEPTGKSVAFLADALVDGRVELFARALDAGAPQLRSGTMPATGDVVEFAYAGDGRNLVYRADQVSDGRFDLFSTPILSSFGPAKGARRSRTVTTLLSALPAGRQVQPDWRCTADGSAVIYRANANANGVIELFRVPIDGSALPTRLSAALVAGGNVSSFAITPERTVYLADQRFNDRIEIFGVPLAGGATVALDALPSFGDVLDFRIAPGGAEVVFRADGDTDEVLELYRASIDGTTEALRVNGPLTPGGDVQPDFAALAELTFYLADQLSNDVFELFETR